MCRKKKGLQINNAQEEHVYIIREEQIHLHTEF